jgi:hypothetical protein
LRSDGIFPSAVTLGDNSIISDFTGYHRSPLNVDNSEEKFLNLQIPDTLDLSGLLRW